MPLSTINPTFADDPNDPDVIWITLGPETLSLSKAEIGQVIDGMRRTREACMAQMGNILVGEFPTSEAVQAATAVQIAAVVSQAPFYW